MKTYFNASQTYHSAYSQSSGFSAITMVMILMALGLLLLTGFHQFISSWQKSIMIEQRYYLNFNQASSSLNLAIIRSWQPATNDWQCQFESTNKFKVCIKKSNLKTDNYILVRGEFEDFYLYALAHQYDQHIQFEKGHWLDYCPEKKSIDCE